MIKPVRIALYLILAVLVFAADQFSKWAVTQHMIRQNLGLQGQPSGFWDWLSTPSAHLPFTAIEITPFFNIVMVWNTGVSFGMFNENGDFGAILLIGLSFLISIFLLVWLFRSESHIQLGSLALMLGGAMGNVVDRARFGAVVDFLDFHLAGYHWPAFNLSDSCIVVGVFLLIVQSFFFETANKDAK